MGEQLHKCDVCGKEYTSYDMAHIEHPEDGSKCINCKYEKTLVYRWYYEFRSWLNLNGKDG